MNQSVSLLTQRPNIRRRYPRDEDRMFDYFGANILQHANRETLNRRLQQFNYVVWPISGNAEIIPIVVVYLNRFHTLFYGRGDMSYPQFRTQVASVCNTGYNAFSLWYALEKEYVPLDTVLNWTDCIHNYDAFEMRRRELLAVGI
ncbi:hypothetical protein HanHA89_Chr12g0454671 [Helianthus annuus]|nr:hypothetical protein HanHA89_Chr12g0454671 [Helianthus annuus]